MKNATIIRNGRIVLPDQIIENGSIVIEDGKIIDVSESQLSLVGATIIDAKGKIVMPGFIDLQVNGAGGYIVTNATHAQMKSVRSALANNGTTSFLAATSPCKKEESLAFLDFVADEIGQNSDGAQLIGIHMEGPFLNPEKSGANDPSHVSLPDNELFFELSNRGTALKMMTVSPEIGDFSQIIETASAKSITLSMGHTTATYSQGILASKQGIKVGTHLFNTMLGITAREPGLILALADSGDSTGTVICDGNHVHPSNLKMLFGLFGASRLIMITDSAPTAGTEQKEWDFEGMKVFVKDFTCYSEKGSIMGSSLTMNKAAMFAKQYMGCTLLDVVKMGSENPAKTIGVFDCKGSIEKGKDADIIIIENDEFFDVVFSMVRGSIMYSRM